MDSGFTYNCIKNKSEHVNDPEIYAFPYFHDIK